MDYNQRIWCDKQFTAMFQAQAQAQARAQAQAVAQARQQAAAYAQAAVFQQVLQQPPQPEQQQFNGTELIMLYSYQVRKQLSEYLTEA